MNKEVRKRTIKERIRYLTEEYIPRLERELKAFQDARLETAIDMLKSIKEEFYVFKGDIEHAVIILEWVLSRKDALKELIEKQYAKLNSLKKELATL